LTIAGWSTKTSLNCPAQPPIYHRQTGVYQYGSPDSDYVPSSDLSFDYYPEYPNPSGHVYNQPWVRDTYESQPGIGYYQRPLLNRYRKGYKTYTAASGFNPFSGWRTHPRLDEAISGGMEQGDQGSEEGAADVGAEGGRLIR
jgi:hypothetical protein